VRSFGCLGSRIVGSFSRVLGEGVFTDGVALDDGGVGGTIKTETGSVTTFQA